MDRALDGDTNANLRAAPAATNLVASHSAPNFLTAPSTTAEGKQPDVSLRQYSSENDILKARSLERDFPIIRAPKRTHPKKSSESLHQFLQPPGPSRNNKPPGPGNAPDLSSRTNSTTIHGGSTPEISTGKEPPPYQQAVLKGAFGANDNGAGDRRGPEDAPRMFLDIIICRPRNPQYAHAVHPYLLDLEFRSAFLSKVMLVKFLKWLFASAMALSSPYVPHFRDYVTLQIWTITIPLSLIFIVFIFLRSNSRCQSIGGCIVSIILFTLCLGLAGSILYCALHNALIPTIMITLTCTYGTLALLSGFNYLDLTGDGVIVMLLILVVSFSLMAFVLISRLLLSLTSSGMVQQIGVGWFPAMMITQSVTLVEVAEIKAVIDGIRIDLGPYDWIIVSAFVL